MFKINILFLKFVRESEVTIRKFLNFRSKEYN